VCLKTTLSIRAHATPTPRPTQQPTRITKRLFVVHLVLLAQAFLQLSALLLSCACAELLRNCDSAGALDELKPEDESTTSRTPDRAADSEATRFPYGDPLSVPCQPTFAGRKGVIRYDRTLTNREHLRQVVITLY